MTIFIHATVACPPSLFSDFGLHNFPHSGHSKVACLAFASLIALLSLSLGSSDNIYRNIGIHKRKWDCRGICRACHIFAKPMKDESFYNYLGHTHYFYTLCCFCILFHILSYHSSRFLSCAVIPRSCTV